MGCVTDSPNNKNCDIPIISWRFVAATMDGEPRHWRTMGGDAQRGEMQIIFDGKRVQNPRNSYDPMRKQGAIILGNGGDNSNGSQGTFYEGAMTAAGTFPSKETNQKLQANIVAVKYDVARLSIAPASATATPPGLQTFSPRSSQDTTVTFKNVTGMPVTDVKLSISAPRGWTAVANHSAIIAGPVAPGASVSATFKVTSGNSAFNGDLAAKASWKADGHEQSDTAIEKARNVSAVKINEFANGPTDSFIELYNAGDSELDLSDWVLTEHPIAQPIFSTVKIPSGTKLAPKGFYVLGLANSGLAVPAKKGDTTLYVRSTTGINVGDTIQIDTGSAVENRKIASVGTPAGNSTTLWQSLPDGPIITIPPGSSSVPYTAAGSGFGGFGGGGGFAVEVGQKLGLGYGAIHPSVAREVEKYEVVTVTAVGKPGTQTYLAADVKAGDTTIRVRNAANISVGDKINLDIDSVGHGTETITVKSVGAIAAGDGGRGGRGGGGGAEIEPTAPLKFNHASNLPFSVRGTGISFEPATKFAHTSNEPLLPLGTGITLDKRLSSHHAINAVVRDAAVTTMGYQGPPAPNQWFGGPGIGNDGSIVLRDAEGLVVDSLNYGRVVDPWAAEGYQGASPGNGCSVPSLGGGRGGFGGRGGSGAGTTSRSAGRFPDGADTDSNCDDFHLQTSSSLSTDSAVGANNIKVSSVDFSAGQTIIIDTGANRETAVIATVGTPGGTTVSTATEVGATAIPVANAFGFSPGQTITIDSGANQETAVVASVSGARGGRVGGFGGGRGGAAVTSVTVAEPLKTAHAIGAQVSGSGITLTAALTKEHESGAQVAGNVPTPGAPNQYAGRTP